MITSHYETDRSVPGVTITYTAHGLVCTARVEVHPLVYQVTDGARSLAETVALDDAIRDLTAMVRRLTLHRDRWTASDGATQ